MSCGSRFSLSLEGMLEGMQRLWLLPVAVAFATVTMIALHAPRGVMSEPSPPIHRTQSILSSIEQWQDPYSGVSLAYPAGWTPMLLPDIDSRSELLEPGFSFGFESQRSSDQDVFADYLLVEILPGNQSGQFVTDGSQRFSASIDGRIAWRDRLLLEEHPIGADSVDLSIHQAGFAGLGYTVGLYVIGEQAESVLLGDVFEVLLQTFSLDGEPFQVI